MRHFDPDELIVLCRRATQAREADGCNNAARGPMGSSSRSSNPNDSQASVRRILEHVGESAAPSPLSPSRAPPWAEFAWDGGGGDSVDQRTAYTDEPW